MKNGYLLPGLMLIALAAALPAGCLGPPVPGTLDPSFNSPQGYVIYNSAANGRDRGVETLVQADGKILVLGYSQNGAGEDVLLARYNADGRPDPGFGKGGVSLYDGGGNDRGLGLGLQADGKIVAVGYCYLNGQRDVLVLRYDRNGTLDPAFGTGGVATYSSPGAATDIGFGVALQAEGGIVVAGETASGAQQDALVLRLTASGSLDRRFGQGGIFRYGGAGMDRAFAAAVQPDGKIVVAGSSAINRQEDVLLFRLTPEGRLDDSFGLKGAVPFSGAGDNADYGNWVTLQDDGKIVVSGAVTNGAAFDILLLRYNPNGALDATFGAGGSVVFGDGGGLNDYGLGHVIQRDGKIVVAGYTRHGSSDDVLLVRFDSSGGLDRTFGAGGSVRWNGPGGNMDYGQGIALQADGRPVVTGFSHNGANDDLLLMRFLP